MSADQGCPIIEAVCETFPALKTLASSLPEEGEHIIGSFVGNKNILKYTAACQKCLGDIAVVNSFNEATTGLSSRINLPDSCPQKPSPQDAPTLFYEEIRVDL